MRDIPDCVSEVISQAAWTTRSQAPRSVLLSRVVLAASRAIMNLPRFYHCLGGAGAIPPQPTQHMLLFTSGSLTRRLHQLTIPEENVACAITKPVSVEPEHHVVERVGSCAMSMYSESNTSYNHNLKFHLVNFHSFSPTFKPHSTLPLIPCVLRPPPHHHLLP